MISSLLKRAKIQSIDWLFNAFVDYKSKLSNFYTAYELLWHVLLEIREDE